MARKKRSRGKRERRTVKPTVEEETGGGSAAAEPGPARDVSVAQPRRPGGGLKALVLIGLPVVLLFQIAFATKLLISEMCLARGNMARRAGLTTEAQQWYARSCTFDPRNYRALHLLGGAMVARGDYPNAARVLDRCLELAPYHPLVLDLLAIAYMHMGELDRATETIERADRVVPDSPYVRSTRGRILVERGQYDDAVNEFREAVRLGYKPEDEVLRAIANTQFKAGDLDAAIATAVDAVGSDPDNPLNHLVHGQLLMFGRQLEPAASALRQAIDLFGKNPGAGTPRHRMHAHLALATTYIDLGRLADAAVQLFQMQKLDATDQQTFMLIDTIETQLDAAADRLGPNETARTRFLLARCMVASGQKERGYEAIRRVAHTDGASQRLRASAHAELARLMAALDRNFDDALAELALAEQIDPSLPQIQPMRKDITRLKQHMTGQQKDSPLDLGNNLSVP